MMMKTTAIAAWLLHLPATSLGCTVFLVGKDASKDGSSMVTHSNDGDFETDPRLVRIPAKNYTKNGTKRPIFYSPESTPRYVGIERGIIPEYYPTEAHPIAFEPIGRAPDLGLDFDGGDLSDGDDEVVATTYAYLEESYGVVNEVGLAMGESTCSGVFGAIPLGQPDGTALWSINELSQIAMERTSTARDAVKLMGTLAEYHGGFYGASDFEGTAESLAITDKASGENWLFHILPDPTGTSAIWAAQRIPSNAVAVLANMFVIRQIDPDKPDEFLMSDNVHSIATKYGWYDPDVDGLLDFTKVYSDGEYAHKYYSGRRVWGAFRLACPTQTYSDVYSDLQSELAYPVYCIPDDKIDAADLMSFHRDYYAGTKYDMTVQGNLAGGPFSSPDRWKEGPNEEKVGGAWERTIAIFRSSDTFIVQTDPGASTRNESSDGKILTTTKGAAPVDSVLWYGPSSSLATVFTPFTVHMKDIPIPFRSGLPTTIEWTSAFWAATVIMNLSNLKWSYMIKDIRKLQAKLESDSIKLVNDMIAAANDNDNDNESHMCGCKLTANANKVVEEMWKLADRLMFKYASGFVNEPDDMSQIVGYPEWWLEAVGFADGPPPPPTKPKCCHPQPIVRVTEEGEVTGTEVVAEISSSAQNKVDLEDQRHLRSAL